MCVNLLLDGIHSNIYPFLLISYHQLQNLLKKLHIEKSGPLGSVTLRLLFYFYTSFFCCNVSMRELNDAATEAPVLALTSKYLAPYLAANC